VLVLAAPRLGRAPWPPTYLARVHDLRGQLNDLGSLLRPLQDAHRAFKALGGEEPTEGVTERWTLPAGASLIVEAGFRLTTEVGDIGRGVIPPPDPVVCLASALHTAELWAEAMTTFAQAARWAIEQAEQWHVSVPGFD